MLGCTDIGNVDEDAARRGGNEDGSGSSRNATITRASSGNYATINRTSHTHTRGERARQDLRERIGRDPDNHAGEEAPFGTMAKRTGAICLFFVGGCFIVAGDAFYSWATSQPRGAATGSLKKPGMDHLKSSYITSLLESTGEEIHHDTDSKCRDIIECYYENCDIFNTTGTALEDNARRLRKQLFRDISARRNRKVAGDRIVFWTGMILAALVTSLTFVEGILKTSPNSEDEIENIGFANGAFALLTLLSAQIIHKATIVDAEATTVLERVRKWAADYVTAKQAKEAALAEQAKQVSGQSFLKRGGTRVEELLPTEHALYNLQYKIKNSTNFDNSLLEAVARIRNTLAGAQPTSIFQVHKQLKRFLEHEQMTSTTSSAHVLLTRQTSQKDTDTQDLTSDEMLEKLALLYDCPIFVIAETPFKDGKYCKLINEAALTDSENKDAEEDPIQYQKQREARVMIFYTSEAEFYQAVVPPTTTGMEKTFADMKSELLGIQPVMYSVPEDYASQQTRNERFSSASKHSFA
ncbi:MAG: hypothetical protein P1U32_00960 [Legionellaceae bacterium]|nr:hypothetical protein [Legionellaceae bacterium]